MRILFETALLIKKPILCLAQPHIGTCGTLLNTCFSSYSVTAEQSSVIKGSIGFAAVFETLDSLHTDTVRTIYIYMICVCVSLQET